MAKRPRARSADIHAQRIQNEMFILCGGERCKKAKHPNAFAVWTRQMFCSRCRARKAR